MPTGIYPRTEYHNQINSDCHKGKPQSKESNLKRSIALLGTHRVVSERGRQGLSETRLKHAQLDLPECNCWAHKAKGHGTKGLCPICKREQIALCQDHDHETGINREMICMRCNMVLGSVKDNPELLRSMASYLEIHMQVAEANGYDPQKALGIAERVAASLK